MFIQTPDITLGNIQLAGYLTMMKVNDEIYIKRLECLLLE